MSDSDQCTLSDPRKPSFREVQDELQVTADALHSMEQQLQQLAHKLPKRSHGFEALAELRAAMDCVRSDLLDDAIETLRFAANLDEENLQQRFEERRKWQIVVI